MAHVLFIRYENHIMGKLLAWSDKKILKRYSFACNTFNAAFLLVVALFIKVVKNESILVATGQMTESILSSRNSNTLSGLLISVGKFTICSQIYTEVGISSSRTFQVESGANAG